MRGGYLCLFALLFSLCAAHYIDEEPNIQTKEDLLNAKHRLPGEAWGFVYCSPPVYPRGCLLDSGKLDYLLTFTPSVGFVPVEHRTRFYYHFPKHYSDRVLFLFHGHEGQGSDWFKVMEMANFTNYAVSLGFGVVVLDSDNGRNLEGMFSRNAAVSNPDYQNLLYVVDFLKKQEIIDVAVRTAYYAAGLGYGGEFAQEVALWLPLDGVILIGSAPFQLALNDPFYKTHTAWVRGLNDNNLKPNYPGTIEAARDSYEALGARNISTQFCVYPRFRLQSSRNSYFTLIPGVTLDDSGTIYKVLRDEGVLDAKDFVVQDPTALSPNTLDALKAAIPKDSRGHKRKEVLNMLTTAYAGHAVNSDLSFDVFNFLAGRPPRKCYKDCWCTQHVAAPLPLPSPAPEPDELQAYVRHHLLDLIPQALYHETDDLDNIPN